MASAWVVSTAANLLSCNALNWFAHVVVDRLRSVKVYADCILDRPHSAVSPRGELQKQFRDLASRRAEIVLRRP